MFLFHFSSSLFSIFIMPLIIKLFFSIYNLKLNNRDFRNRNKKPAVLQNDCIQSSYTPVVTAFLSYYSQT